VRMKRGMLDALDAWISDQPEPRPNRPEAVRRMVAAALGKARKAAAVKSPSGGNRQTPAAVKATSASAKALAKARKSRGPGVRLKGKVAK
jgi:hypothetical protein